MNEICILCACFGRICVLKKVQAIPRKLHNTLQKKIIQYEKFKICLNKYKNTKKAIKEMSIADGFVMTIDKTKPK